MTGAEISILVTAKDQASKVLQGVQKEANGLQKTLGTGLKFAALGAAAGIGVAGFALAGFVKEAAKEQAQIAQLEKAVRNTGYAFEDAGQIFDEHIRAAEKLAFSDDQARQALIQLTNATGDTEEAQKRLSIAMDLARGTGMDLEMASKLIGKVNEDNIQVLKRYGITLREGATEQEALAEIQQKFSGQAATYAETATAKWEIFNNQLDNIKETIGAALLPTLTKLGTALGDFLFAHQDDIERLADAFSVKLAKSIDDIGKAIEPHLPTLKAFGEDVLTGWDAILTTLQPKLNELGAWLSDNQPVAIALGVAIGGVIALMIGWPAILIAVALSAGLLTAKIQELRQENEDLDEVLTALGQIIGPLSFVIGVLAAEAAREWAIALAVLAEAIKGVQSIAASVRSFIDDVRWAFDRAKDAAYFFKDALYSVRDAAYAVRDAINSIPSPSFNVPGLPKLPKVPLPRLAGGMANVPHDMYPAYLDKGERVLTASENRAYSGGSAVNVTNTFNVYGNPSDAQKREWIQDVEDAQRRAIRIAGLGGGFAYEGAFVNSGV